MQLSLTVALLLSAMCAVEGQSAASGAAAAGGGGGFGGPATAAAAAAAAAAGGVYGGPGYIGPGFAGGGYGSGYRPQYVYNPVPSAFPSGGRFSSYVNAAKKIKSNEGASGFSDLFNHFFYAKLFNNNNG